MNKRRGTDAKKKNQAERLEVSKNKLKIIIRHRNTIYI